MIYQMDEKWYEKINKLLKLEELKEYLDSKSFPGFSGVSIYRVAQNFKLAVFQGDIATRSGSLAFNFFLAIFPGILFLLSLMPFVPLEGFFDNLISNLKDILPSGVKEPVLLTIKDLIEHEREGVLVFNILLTLYFASNGVVNLMTQFNNTNLFKEKRVWWKKRLVAIFLVLILTLLIFTSIILITSTKQLMSYFFTSDWDRNSLYWGAVNLGRWFVVTVLFYVAISCVYYLGPAKRRNWKFFSIGSILATVMIILSSLGFSYYVNHFSNYNAIYGSIGSIIIVMLYFQLNSFILLLGFELNASIRKGRLNP